MTGPAAKLVTFDRQFVPQVRDWILNRDLRDLVGTVIPPSDYQHEQWYERLQSDPARHTFIISDSNTGEAIGIIGLINLESPYRKAEVWLYLGEAGQRRKGVGNTALRELLRIAFEDLGLHRIYAHVISYNDAAKAFFERCGFTEEGVEREAIFKRGKFHGLTLLSILRSEYSGS